MASGQCPLRNCFGSARSKMGSPERVSPLRMPRTCIDGSRIPHRAVVPYASPAGRTSEESSSLAGLPAKHLCTGRPHGRPLFSRARMSWRNTPCRRPVVRHELRKKRVQTLRPSGIAFRWNPEAGQTCEDRVHLCGFCEDESRFAVHEYAEQASRVPAGTIARHGMRECGSCRRVRTRTRQRSCKSAGVPYHFQRVWSVKHLPEAPVHRRSCGQEDRL